MAEIFPNINCSFAGSLTFFTSCRAAVFTWFVPGWQSRVQMPYLDGIPVFAVDLHER